MLMIKSLPQATSEQSTSKLEEQEVNLCSSVYSCATQEVMWLRELFKGLHNEQTKPTVIHAAIQIYIKYAIF